jgi:hypothetical protein
MQVGSQSVHRTCLFLLAFAVLLPAILLRPPKWLSDFDQYFYVSIAYDLLHHGVFSNGAFDNVDSTKTVPPPGRFFGPIYPGLVAVLAGLDPRFGKAVACIVEVNERVHEGSQCEAYDRPVRIVHAALLAGGVLAIALASEVLFLGVFWLTGVLAVLALLADVDLFSFVMTESATFFLYSLAAWLLIRGLKAPTFDRLLLAGLAFGLLTLTRTAYLALAVVCPVLILLASRAVGTSGRKVACQMLGLALGWAVVIAPWLARNAVSTGHLGLTEEYGSAALIERFAYNSMTEAEFLLAFPYCLPGIGEPIASHLAESNAMDRFVYYKPNSFFHAGRGHRDKLVEEYGRLDPLIMRLIAAEFRENPWRHLLVSVPLGWCGMWVGGWLGLLLVPFFGLAIVTAERPKKVFLVLYSAPAFAMLVLHALIANQYTRYNLILIGPFSIATAWLIKRLFDWSRSELFGRASNSGDAR